MCVAQTLLTVRLAAAELFPQSERASYGGGCSADPISCCKVDYDSRPLILFKTTHGIECRNAHVILRKKDGKVPYFVCRPPGEVRKLLDDIHDFASEK